MTIRTKIIKIGNSQGVRISKGLLEQTGIGGDVVLEGRNGEIIIHAVRRARENWDDAFSEMASRGDDSLLDHPSATSDWDNSEWEWK